MRRVRRLLEASRRDLVIKSRRDGKVRFKKRLGYQVTNFRGVDLKELFENDYFVFTTPIGDHVCAVAFPGVFSQLKDSVKFTSGDPYRINLQMVIRALSKAFDATDEVKIRCSCGDFCLSGDTEIKLLEGVSIKVEDLLKEFDSGRTDLWVYSVDEESHDFRPGHILDVWISGTSKDFIEVTLDNDEVIRTTPNHLYMLRDGTYKRADELVIGQSLTPDHYVKDIKLIHLDKEEPVYDLTVDKYGNFMVTSGVILHNCYRMEYWAYKNGYLYGKPDPGTEAFPEKTNPDDSLGSACKHLNLLLSNKRWLIKAASVVNSFIKAYPDKAALYLYDDPEEEEEDEVIDLSDEEEVVEEEPEEVVPEEETVESGEEGEEI